MSVHKFTTHSPAPGGEDTPHPLLSISGVKAAYGHIVALKGIDLDIYQGEIVTLIGANGAGKSTLMMTIFGAPRAHEGRIVHAGHDITSKQTHEIARLSIAQSPKAGGFSRA